MKKIYLALLLSFSSILSMKANPDSVKVGAYMMSLHDISFHDNEYTARFWLWFVHKNKNFDFSTQTEVPNAKSIEKPDIMTYNYADNLTWQIMKMKTVMKQHWDVGDYPFDHQNIKIKFENTVYDKNSLVFVADTQGSTHDQDLIVDGWKVKNFKVATGISHYKTSFGDPESNVSSSDYSNFSISMTLKRDAWGLFLKLFIGMYIAFMIGSVSFLINLDNAEPRFGLPVGALFAAVGNKYIIDSILPETSEFTLVDSLHAITFVFILFIITTSALTLILHNKERTDRAKKLNKKFGIAVVSSYFILNLIMILIAIF